MKTRVVPMTQRLQKALTAFRHLRGDRVLYADSGESVTAKVLQKWMARAQRRANLRATGAIHILRHTFCSHLAMRGAPALSIRHLAGHEDLQTTLGYMHLARGETERAIGLLEQPAELGPRVQATSPPTPRSDARPRAPRSRIRRPAPRFGRRTRQLRSRARLPPQRVARASRRAFSRSVMRFSASSQVTSVTVPLATACARRSSSSIQACSAPGSGSPSRLSKRSFASAARSSTGNASASWRRWSALISRG